MSARTYISRAGYPFDVTDRKRIIDLRVGAGKTQTRVTRAASLSRRNFLSLYKLVFLCGVRVKMRVRVSP